MMKLLYIPMMSAIVFTYLLIIGVCFACKSEVKCCAALNSFLSTRTHHVANSTRIHVGSLTYIIQNSKMVAGSYTKEPSRREQAKEQCNVKLLTCTTCLDLLFTGNFSIFLYYSYITTSSFQATNI